MLPVILFAGTAVLLVHALSSKEDEVPLPKRRLFISHSWELSLKEYSKFVSKLKYEADFYNHSIPRDRAFPTWNPDELRAIFRQQMSGCQKIFVLAHIKLKADSYVGMELEIAKEMGKKIIAIRPYGQQKVPGFIKKHASKVIANNIVSIVKELQS